MAEEVGASWNELTAAIFVGYEIAVRISAGRDTALVDTASTGKWCGFGVAAAVGRLRGVSREVLTHAIAIAGMHSPSLAGVIQPDSRVHLERYISLLRPMFPNAADSNRLWLASKGKPMARHAIYDAVVRTSLRLFGTAIPPHGFRSIAATFLAEASPEDALRARPLLGHHNQETTETYYIKACQIDASRKVTEALAGIRGGAINSRKSVYTRSHWNSDKGVD